MTSDLTQKNQDPRFLETTGHFTEEEMPKILASLFEKLIYSQAGDHPTIINPLADFVYLSKIPVQLDENTIRIIKDDVESAIYRSLHAQEERNEGRFEPHHSVDQVCYWGIVATHLEIPYSLDSETLKRHPLKNSESTSNIADILNFELYHYNYEEFLESPFDFLPLDIIYFAQINGLLNSLERQLISPLSQKCAIPEVRQATVDETIEYLQTEIQRIEEKIGYQQDAEDIPPLKKEITEIEQKIAQARTTGKVDLEHVWETSLGTVLCYPTTEEFAQSGFNHMRKQHSLADVKNYLGPRLETKITNWSKQNDHEDATHALYRRNRVKAFLGSDINIPRSLAQEDDNKFSSTNPLELMDWVNNMVQRFSPHDMGTELVIPSTLNKKEYRMYRVIKKTMDFIYRGALTYDTQEKRSLLVKSADLPLLQLDTGRKPSL